LGGDVVPNLGHTSSNNQISLMGGYDVRNIGHTRTGVWENIIDLTIRKQ
jgi:hypothetical protein